MYHYSNQQLYHHNHNPYQHCPINIQDTKLQNLNTISEAQYEVLSGNAGSHAQLLPAGSIIEQAAQQSALHPRPALIQNVQKKKSAPNKLKKPVVNSDESKKTKKLSVDTSTFTIAERLVAAVWVHERKYTSTTISQINHNFRRRFGREPPSKTTLFAWERKLFSTGNVCDAPRTGRPVNRKRHISAVAASVRSAPALSLRARALALRLPRTTLHNILRNDLPHTTANLTLEKEKGADKALPKHRIKQRVAAAPPPQHGGPHAAPPPQHGGPHAAPPLQHCGPHAAAVQAQGHGYTSVQS